MSGDVERPCLERRQRGAVPNTQGDGHGTGSNERGGRQEGGEEARDEAHSNDDSLDETLAAFAQAVDTTMNKLE